MTDAADIFAAFRCEVAPQTPLRTAITAAYRAPEPQCVPPLLELATANADEANRIRTLAGSLVVKLRAKTRFAARSKPIRIRQESFAAIPCAMWTRGTRATLSCRATSFI